MTEEERRRVETIRISSYKGSHPAVGDVRFLIRLLDSILEVKNDKK